MLTSDIPGPPRLDGGPIPSEIPDWMMWAALTGLLLGLVVFIAVRLAHPTDIRMAECLGQRRAGSSRREADDFTERAVSAMADEAQEVTRAVGIGAMSVLLTASVVDMDALASAVHQYQWVVAGMTPLIVAVGAGGEGVKWLARRSARVRRAARSRYMTRLNKTQHKVR